MIIQGFIYLGSLIAFLKFTAFMSGVTLATMVTVDLAKNDMIPINKLVRLLNNVKSVKGYPLNEGHTVVLGMTRHGKTFATMHTFKRVKEGVLFFNVQHEEVPKEYVRATKNDSFDMIDKALKQGMKINYLPDTDLPTMQNEIAYLIQKLYDGTKRNIYLIIDECHLMKKGALEQVQRVATTGLRFGIKGVFCSQRGALIDNTLISQSTLYIAFYNNQQDQNYWRQYGFPIDELMGRINGEKYYFCTYDGKEIKGAYKIG